MTISLRLSKPDDEEFMLAVYASTRTEEMALVNWTGEQKRAFLHMQFNAQRQHYLSQYPKAAYYLVEQTGQPVGRMIVDRSANETLLVDIALLPDFRNLGLGSSLLRSLQAEGKKISLHVIRSNPAVNLYQRLGFVFVGEAAFYSTMEWSPTAARNYPWTGLCVPIYHPAALGPWSIKKMKQVAQFGYFQDWQGLGDIDALYHSEQTWMSTARDEVDSQAPHIAAASGHTVLMGAGMGIALYNLLSKAEVTRVTMVERDPRVIELLQQSAGFEQWPGIGKLYIEIADALAYLPDRPVDHLYVDIWATPGERRSIQDMQRIQANVCANQVGWWGQELLYLDWLNGEIPTLENYHTWANELGLPLIEQDNPAYPGAVKQVSKSYCYRMFQSDPTRAKLAQPA